MPMSLPRETASYVHGRNVRVVPGAGGAAWYWHLVVAELERRGREAIAVDLPAADDSAGLAAYTDVVVEAIGDRRPVVLVAQSFGGFTAPLVCERVPVELLILVNAMVPGPARRSMSGGRRSAGRTRSARSTWTTRSSTMSPTT